MTLWYTDQSSTSARPLGLQDVNNFPQSEVIYPDRHAQLWETLRNEYDQDAFTKRAWSGPEALCTSYMLLLPRRCLVF